jgi:hypothetical protein
MLDGFSRSGSIRFRDKLIGALLLLALISIAPRDARAEQLQRLHISTFTLALPGAPFKVGQPIRLVVYLHASEHVTALPNLVLPPLPILDVLGDEKHLVSSAAGTDYTEYVTLVARVSGDFTIAPAYLDAIDARDGKPKRFLSNGLTLHVTGEPLGTAQVGTTLATALRAALLFVAPLAGILIIVGLALLVFALRRKPVTPSATAEPRHTERSAQREVEGPPPTLRSVLSAALDELRAHPTRATALAVRIQLWSHLGVDEGATLADVLRCPAAHDARTRAALRAVERAAFTYDADLSAAIADAANKIETLRDHL